MNALGAASTTNFDTGQLAAAQQSSLLNFFGQLAGAAATPFTGIFGKLIPKPACWIAEAIYGVDDPRTNQVRMYLNGKFRETIPGACVMTVYLIIGRQVAGLARRSEWLQRMLKPLFDRALKAATLPF